MNSRPEDYKDVGMPALVPTSPGVGSADSPRGDKSSVAPSKGAQLRKEDYLLAQANQNTARVPVIGPAGKPLMPTKPSRARKWMQQGIAVGKWSKLGIFYVELITEARKKTQPVALGVDPGSKFGGVAIVSQQQVLQTGMLIHSNAIPKKMEQRRHQRRNRRYRKCRRRSSRFNNRKRSKGWLAPSQKAKVQFRLKIIEELRKLYPISHAIVEDVRFNHYQKRWGNHFSTVEIGKQLTYDTLRAWFGKLTLVQGYHTAALRKQYQVAKTAKKAAWTVAAHAIDAVVIAADALTLANLQIASFLVWQRYQYPRRQLHKFQFAKGGIRKREGGSQSLVGFRKGDLVLWSKRDGSIVRGRVGGYLGSQGTLSLHADSLEKQRFNRRFTQGAHPEKCVRLHNQRIMHATIPPHDKATGLPC
ncbi:MAG: RRXRR domain-containing protein [Candidatus Heimdallarchaeota archaeon]